MLCFWNLISFLGRWGCRDGWAAGLAWWLVGWELQLTVSGVQGEQRPHNLYSIHVALEGLGSGV